MARSLDEVMTRLPEAPLSEEYPKTQETPPLQAECTVPDENRTFAYDEVRSVPAKKDRSKTKKLTVAAAVLAAAGVTMFAGMATPASLLTVQPTTEVTETAETEETTEYPRNDADTVPYISPSHRN